MQSSGGGVVQLWSDAVQVRGNAADDEFPVVMRRGDTYMCPQADIAITDWGVKCCSAPYSRVPASSVGKASCGQVVRAVGIQV